MSTALRLKAADAEDLAVIATILQDAVVPMKDMIFQPADARFVLAANRFRWERAGGEHVEGRIYERQRCGVRFDSVKAVRVRGLDQQRRGEFLSILTLNAEPGAVDLVFAGGGVIRLEVEAILCHLDDFDEPWPTMWRPAHPAAGADPADGAC